MYNQAVQDIRFKKVSWSNWTKLRSDILNRPLPTWCQGEHKVARSILEAAVKQACDAFKSNTAKNARSQRPKSYQVRFRSFHHTRTEVVRLQKDSDDPTKKHSTVLKFEAVPQHGKSRRQGALVFLGNNLKDKGGIRLDDSPKVILKLLESPKRLNEDAKILWDKRIDAFYFIFTYIQPRLEDTDLGFERKTLVALDPGVRAFQTWYSPTTHEHGELLYQCGQTIEQRLQDIDALQKRIKKCRPSAFACSSSRCYKRQVKRNKRRRRRRLQSKLSHERVRLTNWMENAHYSAAQFLLQRFDIVLAPRLGVARLVSSKDGVLTAETKRKMLSWCHRQFFDRLTHASKRYAGKYVLEVREPGTSKTCTNCGSWKANLGGSHVYKCTQCGICVNRDVAGARNNFFAAFGEVQNIPWDQVERFG